jgi:hypothetical protein
MRPFAGCCAITLTLSLLIVPVAFAAESPLWVRQVASPGSETMSGIVLGSDEGVSIRKRGCSI